MGDTASTHFSAPTTIDADGISLSQTPIDVTDDNSICLSQDPGGAGNLTIDGIYASGGVATPDYPRAVTITSAGDDSLITFTITGTDENGAAQVEPLAGTNAGTATSTGYFATVTQIAVDGNSSAVIVGTAAVYEPANATISIDGTLASGGTVTLNEPHKVTITSASNDTGITFTITGTDENGDAASEVITGANGAAATSTGYFSTITSVTCSGETAGAVTVGINNSILPVVTERRCRVQSVRLSHASAAGTLNFRDGSASGTVLLKLNTINSATSIEQIDLPGRGILFPNGAYVDGLATYYTTLTVFYE